MDMSEVMQEYNDQNTKNILITTMSTLNFVRRNYYFSKNQDSKKQYCVGIPQTEAGTRWLLSKYRIDEIVVIGSEQTYNDEDKIYDIDNPNAVLVKDVDSDIHKDSSAYAKYSYCIGQYILGKDENTLISDLEEEDNKKALEIVSEIKKKVKEKYKDSTEKECFDKIVSDNELQEECKKLCELDGKANSKIEAFVKYKLYCEMSESLKMRCKEENENTKIIFVPEHIDGETGEKIENISGIVNAIKKECSGANTINLYIDMQGGSRTDGYVRNAIVSILNNDNNSNFKAHQFIATDFNPKNYVNEISDETRQYKITDLVSGMNAFINYGKAGVINNYFKEMKIDEGKNSRIGRLIEQMAEIDNALTICDIEKLEKSIKEVFKIIENTDDSRDYHSTIFSVLEEGIKEDYRIMFNEKGEFTVTGLIRWALKKDFIQQALTIIENRMPQVIFGSKYFDVDLNYFREIEEKNGAGWTNSGKRKNINDFVKSPSYESWEHILLRKWAEDNHHEIVQKDSNGNNVYYDIDEKLKGKSFDEVFNNPGEIVDSRLAYFHYKGKLATNGPEYRIRCDVRSNATNDEIRKFKIFMKIHMALKNQRNMANHASDDGRLEIGVIKDAIQIYIDMAEELGL